MALLDIENLSVDFKTSSGQFRAVDGVSLHVDAGDCGMMTVRAEGEYAVAPGDTIYLTPDAARIHKFDKDGKAIR